MNWEKKQVLVTGAGGFIGSHLAEELVRRGARVRAMVRYGSAGRHGWLDHSDLAGEMEVFAGDIRDAGNVRRAMQDCDVVFHLAALIAIPYSYEAPDSYVRTNIDGTLNVLEAARQLETPRIVHTSTSEVYGTALRVPIDEEHPLQGQSPYSATKIAADKLAESYYRSFNIPVVTIRPFNTYGPRQSTRAVLPTIITQALTGDQIKLGATTPTRDLTYVSDTVTGFLCGGSAPAIEGKTINLGTGTEISIGDLAQLVCKLCDRECEIVCENERLRPEKSEVNRLLSDNSMAKNEMHWTPQFELKAGVEQTIEWIQQNLEHFRAGQYTV